MQYRSFGRLGWQVSALGFGCMRLPTTGSRDEIDQLEATRMLRTAIDQGLNYLDTGYRYHGGHSETFLGHALQDGYRQRVHLATKLWWGEIHETADFDRHLAEQLAKLQTDHLDVYLLHGMRSERWQHLHQLGVLEWAEQAKADGRIRALGFSFHDSLEVFKTVVDAYPWDMCQIQYNYMNETHQAGTAGLRYAAARGLAVVVMEPLLGGKLAAPPAPVRAIWQAAPVQRDPVDWALQWLWSQPEVTVALSGMSSMAQVQANLRYAGRPQLGQLSAEELGLVAKARDAYQALTPIPCTSCGYCLPCPNGVEIPRNLGMLNTGVMYGSLDEPRARYAHLEAAARADACIQCAQCEPKCPQGIPISAWMPVVDRVLGLGESYESSMAPA